MRADANYYFLEAVRTYREGAGTLSLPQWVGYRVWKNMKESRRRAGAGRRLFVPVDKEALGVPEESRPPAELSEDAETVVRLVVGNAPDMVVALPDRAYYRPSDYRRAVWRVLRDYRWTARRIRSTMRELRRAYS